MQNAGVLWIIKNYLESVLKNQEKLAELIDIETTSLSGIESGRHFPSLPTVEKISDKLNVEIKALFDFSHLQPIEKMKADIIKNLDKLDESKISFIHKFFDGLK